MEKQFKPVPDADCLKYRGTPDKPDVKIFVSHRIDFDAEIIDKPPYINILSGAAFDERENINMLGDDTGDNISEKNESFNELTAQYWAWKNVKADYYGLCHYRRYFSFDDEQESDGYGNIVSDYISEENKKLFRLEDYEYISRKVKDYDFIVSTPYIVNNGAKGSKNLFEQYDEKPTMHLADLELALRILRELRPEDYQYAVEYFENEVFYPCNLFIMRKEIFEDYCQWLFPILFEVEKELDTTYYCQEEIRAVGMIGERLLGVYFSKIRHEHPEYRFGIFQRVFFSQPKRIAPLYPSVAENNIPIVFAANNYFVPYTGVAIYSMMKNANPQYHYDIIILTTDIDEYMEKKLRLMLSEFSNCSLRIWDINPYMRGGGDFLNHLYHITKETYYRLFIPDIFVHFDKLIYIDSDLVIQDDISKLYDIDIGEKLIAAIPDADQVGQYNVVSPSVKECYDNILKIKSPYEYFQGGVLVFNLKKMRRKFKQGEFTEYALEKREALLLDDQDVLNIKCEGEVYFLDFRWNLVVDYRQIRIKKYIAGAPVHLYKKYLKARNNPAIIHYAGNEKSWNNPASDFAEVFWHYARQTLFYEIILFRMRDGMIHRINELERLNSDWYNRMNWLQEQIDILKMPDNRTPARKIADFFMPKGSRRRELAKKILPKGSRRWNFCKQIYFLIQPKYRSEN